jgi:hypothetical protein
MIIFFATTETSGSIKISVNAVFFVVFYLFGCLVRSNSAIDSDFDKNTTDKGNQITRLYFLSRSDAETLKFFLCEPCPSARFKIFFNESAIFKKYLYHPFAMLTEKSRQGLFSVIPATSVVKKIIA